MVGGDGQAKDKGLLAADATGGTVPIDGVRGQRAFAITNEPKEGSPVPAPDKVVTIQLT